MQSLNLILESDKIDRVFLCARSWGTGDFNCWNLKILDWILWKILQKTKIKSKYVLCFTLYEGTYWQNVIVTLCERSELTVGVFIHESKRFVRDSFIWMFLLVSELFWPSNAKSRFVMLLLCPIKNMMFYQVQCKWSFGLGFNVMARFLESHQDIVRSGSL